MRIRAVVGAILLFLILGTFCTVGRRVHYTCIDCGLYFQDRVMLGRRFPIYERKARTDWYDRRIAAPHTHRWAAGSCAAGLNLWQSPTSFSCGGGERMGKSKDWLGNVHVRLEAMDLDRRLQTALTHGRVDHRDAAVNAAEYLDPAWDDEKVRAWWGKAQRFLAAPACWPNGFQNFEK